MGNMNDIYGRDLDLNLLRVFAVVAEEQNLTRAASRLYVTQPAISAAIRRLTSFVGAALLVREGRGIALTKRGEELFVAARAYLQPLVAATTAVPVFDPRSSAATVRVGLGDGLEAALLPKLLRRMRSDAPSMQLVVVAIQFRSVEDAILARRVDLAVGVADDLPRSIARETLFEGRKIRDGFTCLHDPRFARLPAKLTARAYFSREHVAVSYAGDARGIVEDALATPRTVRVVVPSLGFVADVVDGSPLLATVPLSLAQHVVRSRPHLRYTPLPFALDGADLDLFWSRASTDDPAVGFMRQLIGDVAHELVVEGLGRHGKRQK